VTSGCYIDCLDEHKAKQMISKNATWMHQIETVWCFISFFGKVLPITNRVKVMRFFQLYY
jgi:uncharacterized membrane protein